MGTMGFKRLTLGLVTLVLIPVSVGLLLSAEDASSKWARLCCEFDDVDINTGQIRCTRYLLYCKVSERIEDSILTRTIGQFPDGVEADWRRVNAFPLGRRYSPHYAYHGAISQIRQVELTWQLCSFSDEAKRHMARTILDKWQSDRSDFGAGRYISDVWDMAREKTELDPKVVISLADLTPIHNKQ
jgi:hypothetical protein